MPKSRIQNLLIYIFSVFDPSSSKWLFASTCHKLSSVFLSWPFVTSYFRFKDICFRNFDDLLVSFEHSFSIQVKISILKYLTCKIILYVATNLMNLISIYCWIWLVESHITRNACLCNIILVSSLRFQICIEILKKVFM